MRELFKKSLTILICLGLVLCMTSCGEKEEISNEETEKKVVETVEQKVSEEPEKEAVEDMKEENTEEADEKDEDKEDKDKEDKEELKQAENNEEAKKEEVPEKTETATDEVKEKQSEKRTNAPSSPSSLIPGGKNVPSNSTEEATPEKASEYIGKSAASLVAAIGQPSAKSYASSCIGDGEDGEWSYPGFTVYTYRDTKGNERIEDVFAE